MNSAVISTVIFDCDGVLVNSELLSQSAALPILAAYGLHYELPEYQKRFNGRSLQGVNELLEADSIARLGRSIVDEIHAPLRSAMRKAVEENLAEVAGATAAIAACRKAKAVASSSLRDRLEYKLKKVDLWDCFAPHIYSAESVERSKPEPDLFLFAANALGVEPAECLVIEDSVHGIAAAKAAGMKVWAFTGGGHHGDESKIALEDEGFDHVFEHWTEAVPLLGAL